jgi:hypothetical protein
MAGRPIRRLAAQGEKSGTPRQEEGHIMLAYVQFLTGYLQTRLIRSERGQGSVEYVGIVLVVGAIMLALIGVASGASVTGIRTAITDGIKDAIDALSGD